MAPTPPVTGPLSWSYLRECETLISGLPSRRRYRSQGRTVCSEAPTLTAAACHASKVLPVAGALIDLYTYRHRHKHRHEGEHAWHTERCATYVRSGTRRTRPCRDHSGWAPCRRSKSLVRPNFVSRMMELRRVPLTDLVVRDVQRPLHAVLQTRVEAALPALRRERLARVGEVALGDRVRDGTAWSGVNSAHRLATQDDPLTWGRRT